MFSLMYYGLLRVGEVTEGNHMLKVKDVYIADNKHKIKLVLYSSKTHNIESTPQEITISADESTGKKEKFFCPFNLTSMYFKLRGPYYSDKEGLFVFRDKSPVQQQQAWAVLKLALKNLNIDDNLYNCQSMRIGSASNLFQFGFSVEVIKRMGRWKSNAVYRYIRLV